MELTRDSDSCGGGFGVRALESSPNNTLKGVLGLSTRGVRAHWRALHMKGGHTAGRLRGISAAKRAVQTPADYEDETEVPTHVPETSLSQ